jgi:tRNA A37 threonylcarbamoyltransferase TsaD
MLLSRHGRHRASSIPQLNIPDLVRPPVQPSVQPKDKPDATPLPPRLLVLAIETSCDDTCVAIVEKYGSCARVIFNHKITSDNREFGGVEPITAVESHTSQIARLVESSLRHLPWTSRNLGPHTLAFDESPRTKHRKPNLICVTRGPGMTASLAVGLTMAKGLAVAWQVPLVGVHHMQAHALTPRLVSALGKPWHFDWTKGLEPGPRPRPPTDWAKPLEPAFPFLSLLVSGGHTQLLLSRSITSHTTLAESQNAAIGDMLDKCARAILPADVLAEAEDVMYGAQLEAFAFPDAQQDDLPRYDYTPPAKRADEIKAYTSPAHGWFLTPPLAERRDMAFDFSGLGGQVQAIMRKDPDMGVDQRRELAREAMRLAFEHVASRIIFALDKMAKERQGKQDAGAEADPTLVVSGGVARNRYLLHVLRAVLRARGHDKVKVACPPPELCTDNAAMIAWAGAEMYEAGWQSELGVRPIRKWSMDDSGSEPSGSDANADAAAPDVNANANSSNEKKKEDRVDGILAADGWLTNEEAAEKRFSLPKKR